MKEIKLHGRIFIEADIKALTGLHIGGSGAGLEIGGVDNEVIRNPLSKQPYIPGSSLRGKMRSQTEKALGLPQNNRIGNVTIHTCKTEPAYNADGGCPVCHVFGVPGEVEATGPTLLLVRDASLTDHSVDELKAARTALPFAELKTEVAIDRVTSAAVPRTLERVPAGAVFGPAEFVFGVYDRADFGRLRYVVEALQLVEDDYLGGSGSRGSGKVSFASILVKARSSQDYGTLHNYDDGREFNTVQELIDQLPQVNEWAKGVITIPTE